MAPFEASMTNENRDQMLSRRHLAKAAAIGGMWPMAAAVADSRPAGDTLLDVRAFAAKGDGKNNDTKAIQSAIDAAAERGGSVFVPPGVYLSAGLQLRPHVGLIGIPGWDYRRSGGSVIRLMDPDAKCLVSITDAFGCTIDGLSLEGDKLGKSVHGVLLNKPTYGKQEDTFRIERSQIANFSGDGVRLHAARKSAFVTRYPTRSMPAICCAALATCASRNSNAGAYASVPSQ
jgi:hypothetical protein